MHGWMDGFVLLLAGRIIVAGAASYVRGAYPIALGRQTRGSSDEVIKVRQETTRADAISTAGPRVMARRGRDFWGREGGSSHLEWRTLRCDDASAPLLLYRPPGYSGSWSNAARDTDAGRGPGSSNTRHTCSGPSVACVPFPTREIGGGGGGGGGV
ncbi:hypothetical protein LA080_003401 [Diaporthe eres]|nr:hypothetical protein LA080_003401 [Diaporthe eres]